MNCRKMMRTLISAIRIAPDVSVAFGVRAAWRSSEPTSSCAIVMADRTSQTTSSLFSDPTFTDHLMT